MRSLSNLLLRKCKQSLVKLLQGVIDFEYLMTAEDSIASLFKHSIQRLFLNAYISTCDEGCLQEWEKIFDFQGNGTIAERKEAVLSRLRTLRVTNEKHIREGISAIFGGIAYTVVIDTILLKMEVTTQNLDSAYLDILRRVERYLRPLIPQNIELLVINELISEDRVLIGVGITECDYLTVQARLPTTMFTRGLIKATGGTVERGQVHVRQRDMTQGLINATGGTVERGQVHVRQRDMTQGLIHELGGVMTIE